MDRAGTTSSRARFTPERYWQVFGLAAAAVLLWRLIWLFGLDQMGKATDSLSYLEAGRDGWARPWLVVGIFKILGTSQVAAICIATLSVAAWASLAASLAAVLPHARWWALTIWVIPIQANVSAWDAFVSSDSIGVTGVVFVVAGLVCLADRHGSRVGAGTALFALGTALATGSRESNLVFAIGLGLLAVWWRGLDRFRLNETRGAALWALAAVLFLVGGAVQGSMSSDRMLPVWRDGQVPDSTAEQVTASNLRVMNIVFGRIANDPDRLTRFLDAGMPDPQRTGPGPIETYYENPRLVAWANDSGLGEWLGYLVSNPNVAIESLDGIKSHDVNTVVRFASQVGTPEVFGLAGWVTPRTANFQLLWNLAAVLVAMFAVNRLGRRDAAVSVIGAVLAILCTVHLIAVVNLDAMEHYRHNLVALVMSPVALILAVSPLVDRVTSNRVDAAP